MVYLGSKSLLKTIFHALYCSASFKVVAIRWCFFLTSMDYRANKPSNPILVGFKPRSTSNRPSNFYCFLSYFVCLMDGNMYLWPESLAHKNSHDRRKLRLRLITEERTLTVQCFVYMDLWVDLLDLALGFPVLQVLHQVYLFLVLMLCFASN